MTHPIMSTEEVIASNVAIIADAATNPSTSTAGIAYTCATYVILESTSMVRVTTSATASKCAPVYSAPTASAGTAAAGLLFVLR